MRNSKWDAWQRQLAGNVSLAWLPEPETLLSPHQALSELIPMSPHPKLEELTKEEFTEPLWLCNMSATSQVGSDARSQV